MASCTKFQLNSVYRHDGLAPAMWLGVTISGTEKVRPIRS